MGGTTTDFGLDITIDASGNLYTTGQFTGTIDFDPGAGTTNLTSAGMRDVFILKFAANGAFIWAKAVGGADNDKGNSLVTDAVGNIYVVGFFEDEADFDPGPTIVNLKAIFFGVDAFVLKLNPSGDFIWAKKMGGFGREEAEDITIDASANIYTIGAFSQSADFDPGAGTNVLASVGFSKDVFVQKLDTDGNFVWARAMGGSSSDDALSISIDASNSLHIASFFQATADFDPDAGVTNLISAGLADIFVLKILQCTPASPVPDVANLTDLTNNECSMATAPTATNNCGEVFTGTSNVSFPISVQGTTIVTWTYNDGNGNTSTQTQNVIIDDVTAPAADATSLPNLTAECSVAMPTAPTATDNCEGTITGTSNVSFPITNQGTTVVTWTFDDGNGNTATQTQSVIINDITVPVADAANLADLTSQCSVAMPTAPTATDNCEREITGTPNVSFPITTQGTTVVTWTFDDGNGNTATQTQNVIINDVTAPIADAANLADLTSQCSVTIPAAPTATDNCKGAIIGTSNMSFPIITKGTTVVTWTLNDGNGNISMQTQNVTININDLSLPVPDVANLADLIVECSIILPTPPTATDNCAGIINGTTNTTFPITTSGTTVITWSFEDVNGNTATQTQSVIINPIDNSVSVSGSSLTANADGYTYQWIDCANSNVSIAGATNQNFTLQSSGNYAVIISNETCTVTLACIDFAITGILRDVNKLGVSVYPNPIINQLIIDKGENKGLGIEIVDETGKLILSKLTTEQKMLIDMSEFASGIYLVNLNTKLDKVTYRIVKN